MGVKQGRQRLPELVAVRTVRKFCEEHMDKIDIVRFVLFDPETLAAYEHAVYKVDGNRI